MSKSMFISQSSSGNYVTTATMYAKFGRAMDHKFCKKFLLHVKN